jgi:SP family myo-inositol transporter-like MFS transporter 13
MQTTNEIHANSSKSTVRYGRWLLCIAGLGGLLYGIDVGIIGAALLYLSKTVDLSIQQTSIVVAAVLGGGMCSSLVAGVLADWLGRRKMMIAAGLIFIASVGLIVISQSFATLLTGRLLQGVSGGLLAVVVPLYLAECLSPETRGRGTAIFQFMLTFGIVIASITGYFYTRQAEAAIAAAGTNAALILKAENHAWRGMFLSVVYPGLLFFLGGFTLSETPRWLFRKGRRADALASLRRSSTEADAQRQLDEMEALAGHNAAKVTTAHADAAHSDSLLRRKYVVPFVLACVILACNQATGINSVLQFMVVMLKQAGMTADRATQVNIAITVLNTLMTLVAVALVDKKGRKFLLKIGTSGIIVALLAGAAVFYSFESKRVDVKQQVASLQAGNQLHLASVAQVASGAQAAALTVIYTYGDGDKSVTAISTEANASIVLAPDAVTPNAPLTIKRAFYGPLPTATTGWLITACLALFIAAFAMGPGVVVWLALSELMPTRIRSTGMGVALLLNQGVSTLIAALFLPVVGVYGYYAMFLFWAGCTVVYFLAAAFFLPETKDKSLEEIERYFESAAQKRSGGLSS